MTRKILNMNTDWFFLQENNNNAKEIEFNNKDLEEVSIPHNHKILPHHYFSEKEYQFVSWYRRYFYLNSEENKDKRIIIEFDGVMNVAEIFVNGEKVGTHKGGYTSFSFDITNFIKFDKKNILAVKVDSKERKDIPPEGGAVDYLLYGGIYREVRLKIVHNTYLANDFWEINKANQKESIISPIFTITNESNKTQVIQIKTILFDKNNNKISFQKEKKEIKPGSQQIKTSNLNVNSPKLWDLEDPYMYKAVAQIYINDTLIDQIETNLGLRSVEFKDDGKFYLNNKPKKLRGLNRHQSFPYIGNAMPARGQKKDAEILKYELGLNFVRSSHYPPSPAFLDKCDEIGLLVFEEIPGWQHLGDDSWKELSLKNVKEMIVRDRNHPSIFLWGTRINESPDDHDFYEKTNKLSHKLDPTRPTSGVRDFQESEFLEDVFSHNDFELNLKGKIESPNHKPYMITEYMGHMYPTKSTDSTERLIKHAVLHARIQDKQYRNKNIAGASGWCAFDYNTHKNFGSGDRICYHGVCDMYRLPKFAAHFYRSQRSPKNKPVVFIARYLTPSFNQDYGDKIVVFSNCEELELYFDDKLYSINKPEYNEYPALPHPPFVFENCNRQKWGTRLIKNITVIGKINGEEVASHTIYPFGQPNKLLLKPDHKSINANGSDMTRVVIKIMDENNQVLPLARYPVFFELEGPGTIIGENPFVLEAGKGAIFVKGNRQSGEIKLKAFIKNVVQTEVVIKNIPIKEEIVPVKANNLN